MVCSVQVQIEFKETKCVMYGQLSKLRGIRGAVQVY